MAVVLLDELIEEILIRLPLADPASLLRAAAVCKRWCRIISAPGFDRRFGERHRAPPVLGFLENLTYDDDDQMGYYASARFLPATPFRPRRAEHRKLRAIDARHGRVLFNNFLPQFTSLKVWDPVTDALWEVPGLPRPSPIFWNAAVVCAAYGSCDHLVCRRDPFLVVFLDSDDAKMRVHVYSSETGAWSEPTYGPASQTHAVGIAPTPSTALVGNALCFLIDASSSILKYDLALRSVSVIHLPPDFVLDFAVLTTMGDDGLGIATLERSILQVWSLETGPDGGAVRAQIRSIDLETLLRVDASSIMNDRLAFAHGVGVFFVGTEDGWFSIELESGRAREEEWADDETSAVVPYTSFYSPDVHRYGVAPV